MTLLKRLVVRALIRLRFAYAFAWLFNTVIRTVPGSRADRPTVLALNPDRFRDDLEILASSGRFRVLRFPFEWQARLLPYFMGRDVHPFDWFKGGGEIREPQDRFRRLLARVARHMARRHGIRCVIGAAVHYVQDVDWGAAFDRIGIPYVVFHKENLVPSDAVRQDQLALYRRLGRFQGTHIVVHNEVMRSIFLDSAFARPHQIAVCGAMRMDPFVERIMDAPDPDRSRLTLFSFFHVVGLTGLRRLQPESFDGVWSRDGSGFVDLFKDVHVEVIRFAADNPDVDVVIKTKWGGRWFDEIRRVALDEGLDPDGLANLRLDAETPAHDLILSSRVICAFGSTTLLEAAVAGRPVIMPMFDEALAGPYRERVFFGDQQDLFDIATSREHLRTLLSGRLADPDVDPSTMEARRAAFERFVSSLGGKATECHISVLERAIRAVSDLRGRSPESSLEEKGG